MYPMKKHTLCERWGISRRVIYGNFFNTSNSQEGEFKHIILVAEAWEEDNIFPMTFLPPCVAINPLW